MQRSNFGGDVGVVIRVLIRRVVGGGGGRVKL
jgi:hypothetical protein